MKTVIFLGPSLPLEEARRVLDAVYLPPAQQTDLLTAAVNHEPDAIGLIDGVFLQSLSVWHKEILHALDQGIAVYGASSMGAIRAAETDSFGMVGVGEVYRQFASGELIDDDEVALAHASAQEGYQKTSEPMVNIRATFQAAGKAGIIDPEQLARLLALAKPIYFAHRTFPAIFEAAAREGFSRRILDRLREFASNNYVDLKRNDAIALLETIRDSAPANGRGPSESSRGKRSPTFAFRRSTAFETLFNRDRQVEIGDMSLHLENVSNYVALHDPDFEETNFGALNRVVVLAFAEMLGLEVEPAAIQSEADRFRRRHNLEDPETWDVWLRANHQSPAEFHDLMWQRALCRRLHRWFLIAMWMERNSKILLDELRLKNRYAEWAARAASHEKLVDFMSSRGQFDAGRIPIKDLIEEHCAWNEGRIDLDPADWAEEAGFHSIGNLKLELARANMARRAMLELLERSAPEGDEGDEGEDEPQSHPASDERPPCP